MENQNKSSKLGLIALAAISAILAVLYYRSTESITEKEAEIQKQVVELTASNVKLDSISAQLDAKIAEIQSLGGEVDDLLEVKSKLEKDKKELAAGNLSMLTKISEYEAILTEKDAMIAELKKENGILTENNQALNTKNETLNTENTSLKTDNANLNSNLEKSKSENEELSKTVAIGAQLKAINLSVVSVNAKGKVDSKPPFKAKKIETLRIGFNLAKNPITKLESKKIYLRILDGAGAIVSDNAAGSGVFTFNGKETVYTSSAIVNYNQNEPSVAISYNKGTGFKLGTYSVELYSEGFKIGSGSFVVN